MPKFKKKVVRKLDGGGFGSTPMKFPGYEDPSREEQAGGVFNTGLSKAARGLIYLMGGDPDLPAKEAAARKPTQQVVAQPQSTAPLPAPVPAAQSISAAIPPPRTQRSGISRTATPIPSIDQNKMNAMLMAAAKPKSGIPDLIASSSKSTVPGITALGMGNPLAGLPGAPESEGETTEGRDIAKMSDSGKGSIAKEIPKTKAGMKKFVQDYGKYIALGAMAGQGGKAGQIAAPIIAAIPGLIEMMRKKKDTTAEKKAKGGTIRKFKGGSMNTKDSMLTPKYKKGGSTGEMPQHKKMAMGKPTPQSTGQKFAKGGTMKCATGGVTKGYGISKKIKPSGPMC